jgi:XTP/dITP diphosphohydrolase
MNSKIAVVYVTSSEFKKKENEVFLRTVHMEDDVPVHELFLFEIRELRIKEVLEVDIERMVIAEVEQAYSQIKVPCVVEHAGLIFDGYPSYPGGLTKPMWNALGASFLAETNAAGRGATARAVVAYCDGQKVQTFVGETKGQIASKSKGSHEFYWDTIFIPDVPTADEPRLKGKTYAEITDEKDFGLDYKVSTLSQSSKAMLKFLQFRRSNMPMLWADA